MKFLLLMSVPWFALASVKSHNSFASDKVPAKAPYPKIRIWTSPASGEEPKFNSPSFQWPTRKKATYSVRISSSRDFKTDLIEKQGLPYAIFNPHKKLDPGTWYWQYRVNADPWNKPDSFVIKASTRVFVTPPIQAILTKIPVTHPRVLIGKTAVDELRKRAGNYKESALLLKEADDYLNTAVPPEASALPNFKGKDDFENEKIASIASKWAGWKIRNVLNTLSQAYLLTGDEKYFKTAKGWMMEVSKWDPNGPSHTNNFGDAAIMESLALGLDTFWELFTEAERKQIVQHAAIRASQFYHLWIGQVESRSSSMHVWQHILHNLLQTSLALKGEIQEADQWLEYIYELWIAQAPKMAEEDGAWFNGTSYFGMNMLSLVDVSSIFKELSGVDFMGSPWFANNPRWLIYAFPPNSVSDGFCNDGERYPFPPINYAGYCDAMARLFGDPYAGWYAQATAKNLKNEIAEDREFRWFRIRKGLNMKLPQPLNESSLPQAAVFPDIGVAYMHTTVHQARTDLMLSLRSSPYGPMAHAHADQNCFNIAYGGKRLFYNTGYRPAMGDPHFLGWYKQTQGHNGILIDGKGQPFSDESFGWIPRFLNGKQLSYAVGDASRAYAGTDEGTVTDHGMIRFRRHFLLLRPSTIVIYDELEANHDAEWSWLLHNDSGLQLNPENNTILAKNDVTYARLSLFASVPVDFRITDQFSVPVNNWTNKINEEGDTLVFKNQWHFKGVSKENSTKMRYLAVIQVKPDGSFEQVINKQNGNFKVGNWNIKAQLDRSKTANLQVWNTDQTVALVSDGIVDHKGKTYQGKEPGSSKLLEWIDGKEYFQEVTDEVPLTIKKIIKNL